MTECVSAHETPNSPQNTTYTDVIKKFKDLQRQYYTERGCIITTMDDEFAKDFIDKHPNLVWDETYNKYAEALVLTAKVNIIIFGKPFAVYLHRPIKQIHRWEYEYFFGFGGHNKGFSHNRIVTTFQNSYDKTVDIEYLLMTGTLADADGDGDACACVIDEKYIKNVLKLLVVGGYVKGWNAFTDFEKWFKERGFNLEFNTDTSSTTTSFIFEDYELVETPVKDPESEP
jgi:hypothetical protein